MCRTNLVCLIDKAWELGGCYLGEEEFENLNDIKDARKQIERIDKIEASLTMQQLNALLMGIVMD